MPQRQAIQAVDKYLLSMMNYLKRYRKFYHDLYLRDLQILLFIHRENPTHQVTVSELANHLKVTPAAASQLISNYEKKDWVERVHSTTDRRTVYIQVSKFILERFRQDIKNVNEALSEELDGLSTDDLAGFTKVLNIISENLQNDAVFFHRNDQ